MVIVASSLATNSLNESPGVASLARRVDRFYAVAHTFRRLQTIDCEQALTMSVRTPAQRRRRASTSTPSSTPSQQPERVPRVMELLTKSDLTEEDTRRIVPFLRDHSDEDTCPDRCTLQGKRYRVHRGGRLTPIE